MARFRSPRRPGSPAASAAPLVGVPARGRRRSPARVALALALLAATAAAGDPGTRLELRGRVLDAVGAPIAGARVELRPIEPRYDAGRRILAGGLAPDAAATVRTSGDGGYLLVVPAAGMWQVVVAADGKIPVRQRLIPLTAGRELPPARLEPDGGGWITVTDEAGAGISGALVWVRPKPEEARRRVAPDGWQPYGRFARADDHGTAYVSRRRGQPLQVWAFAPGFLPAARVEVPGDRGRVPLERGRPIRMRFLTAGGEPAARAILGVSALQWASTTTDPEGRATVFLAPGEPLTFSLHLADGQLEGGTLEAAEEDFDQGEGESEVMTLPRPRVLSGRVVDAATQGPPPAAWVWTAEDPGRLEPVDRAGEYRLIASSGGYWQIGAAGPGYLPTLERGRGGGADAAGPTLILRRQTVLAGRVVDSQGAPVAGAEVVAVEPRDDRGLPGEDVRVTSGADGGFRLTGLAAAARYELKARAAGFAPARVAVDPEAGAEVEIVLAPGRSVVGRLVTAAGEPVAGARLLVTPGDTSWMTMSGLRPAEPAAADSAADGSFRIDGLPAEPSLLVANADGFAPKQVPLFDLPVEDPAAALDLGDLVMERGAAIEGIVRDADESPIAGVFVQVVGSASSNWRLGRMAQVAPESRTSDDEGRFSIGGLAAGERVSLYFDHDDYLRHSVDNVAVDDEPLEVVLERAAKISGRVENERGQPVPGATVRAVSIGSAAGRPTAAFGDPTRRDVAMSDDDGAFTLTRVSPGTVELDAVGQGYVAAGSVELAIDPGERRDGLVLRVERGLALEGTVRDRDGRPVLGAIVQVSEVARPLAVYRSEGVATTRTDADGGYRLEGLDPGADRLDLEVHHPEFLALSRTLELDAGGVSRLDFVLERGFSVSGTILDPRGDPVAGAAVGLDGGSGVYFGGRDTTLSTGDGRFEISGLAPGGYRLFAMKEGFARTTRPEPVEIVDRSLTGLTLQLSRGGSIRGRLLGLEPEELRQVVVSVSGPAGEFATGFVDEDGVYGVLHVGFGEGRVHASLPTGGKHASEPFTVDPEGGEIWVDLELRGGGGSTLSGTVRLNGAPWGRVQVLVQGGFDSRGGGLTDAAGRFEVSGLGDGPHQVALIDRAALSHSETVDVRGDTEVVIDVETVTVRGRVVVAGSGEPVAGARVTAEPELAGWMSLLAAKAETTGTGAFELVLPANRRVALRASAAGRSEAQQLLDTGPGPAIDGVELALGDGGEIELVVRVPAGRPPAWVQAVVVDAEGRRVAAESVTSGRVEMPVRIGSVAHGDWLLRVMADGGAAAVVPVRVPGPPVVVELAPEARVEVDLGKLAGAGGRLGNAQMRIVDANGNPWTMISYGAVLDSWPVASAVTTIPSLPAGEWQVEVTAESGQVWRQPVTAVGGETVRVTFP